MRPKPVVLVVLDGWGVAPSSAANAISMARTPVFRKLTTTYPCATLQAGGEAVGLPWGEMGNSEVGHLTLGAGKILYHDLPRITRSVVDQSFFQNTALLEACEAVKRRGTKLHLMGLVSPGGVHSSSEHLYALLELVARQGLLEVYVHAFLDGRDTPLDSARGYLADLEAKLKKLKLGKVATIMGRFYAMDRDNHWDRIQAAYDCMTQGKGVLQSSVQQAITASYAARVYDEQVAPTVITNADSSPTAVVSPGDAVVFFNFRSDRARQITKAFVMPQFDSFPRAALTDLTFVTMTEYEQGLPIKVVFQPEVVEYPLARVISDAGLKQLHLAETEKYAHVTYFFNGGREQAYPGEEHVLIPSPVVPSYDEKPEMSARGITERLLQEVRGGAYDFYVVNYANADMVGHTGNLPATVRAVEFLDECLGEVVASILEAGGIVFITADHGNAEGMVNPQTGAITKEHSARPVPFIMVAANLEGKAMSGTPMTNDLSQLTAAGLLTDVAPTILKVMELEKPSGMTGQCLL